MSGAPLAPGATLGVVGGGQLGRYFVLEARRLGYGVAVLDPDPDAPAMQLAGVPVVGAYDDPDALDRLARLCDAVTVEFENVPVEALEALAKRVRVVPGVESFRIAQDRALEKRAAEAAGLACVPWCVVASSDALIDAAARVGLPAILKTARLGYDGKGQVRCATLDELRAAFDAMGGVRCVLERRVELAAELSIILARTDDGAVQAFAPAFNRHVDGILDTSRVAADVPAGGARDAKAQALGARAVELATGLAAGIDHRGVLAVEFFVTAGDELLFNEMAPRPHNSGHHTLDATSVSQFEQQLRTLCGLAPAPPRQHSAACMLNLLGNLWAEGEPDFAAVLGVEGACLHLYGKREARAGRKMGHVTCLASDAAQAQRRADAVRAALGHEASAPD